MSKQTTAILTFALAAYGCGSKAPSNADFLDLDYMLSRQYTGLTTNQLTITPNADYQETLSFTISSPDVQTTVPQDTLLPLTSQTIGFSYATPGVYYADFKVLKGNGQPFIFEVLAWEYSSETPEEPIVSFAKTATKTLTNNLLVSDSRVSNTTGIWLTGDLEIPASGELEDEGYWEDLPITTLAVPITLTAGDGLKTIDAKFRNIFGNAGVQGYPAEIILKQTPPTNCTAEALNTIISNNKLSIRLGGTDPYQLYYSVVGDVGLVVSEKKFSDGDEVDVFLEPTPGEKNVTVYIQDIAGNVCLEQALTVTLDPTYENEGIWVNDRTYWTDTENAVLTIRFEHFSDQEPLEVKITGSVAGDNTNAWIPLTADIPVRINPTTTGSRVIYAQYRDVNGTESYLIGKRIFLKPAVTLTDTGGGVLSVVVSHILDAASLTIVGCTESPTYVDTAYQASYTCHPTGANVDVTYKFADASTLTLTKAVPP